jgi:DNA-binding HxlR family transcriptional regulator/putative sterol carrier protein
MPLKRSYQDGCAAAHALDLVGERWALLVVRELLLGPKRFTDLRAGMPGISPNVLAQRLEELERTGVIHRHKLPPPAAAWVYELTAWGLELEPVILALGRWGVRSPLLPIGAPLSVDALILAFRTMFSSAAAAGFRSSIELRFGDDRFHAEIANGRIDLVRGHARQPDAIINASPDALASVVYGGRKLTDALRTGHLEIEGDHSAVKRFVALFPLPAGIASSFKARPLRRTAHRGWSRGATKAS